ncbi:MAG: AMP-binding protein [Rhodoferax sp.]|uniref:AMP-binding protein n=1 Tax=Rhodoferax sp. TaxID=50421 RepID=UPI00260464C7|nr:AMP-binding protein [Rhodoferax sp.]MDD5335391.1 AMP-binding protein [Rhodoferax sp.]
MRSSSKAYVYRSKSERTIGHIVEHKALVHGDAPFLYYKDEVHSYRALHENSNRVAHSLRSLGVKKGDKVATMIPNYPEYFYVWWALHKLGAWEVPISGSYRGASLVDVLNRSDAQLAVIGDGLFLERLSHVQGQLDHIRQVVVAHRLLDPAPSASGLRWPTCNLVELLNSPSDAVETVVFNHDACMIAYTSGTTGPSKGVVLTHEFFVHSCENKVKHMGTTQDDVMYNCFPMYNLTGQLETTFTALMADARVAMAEHFDPTTFWDDIRRYQCTEFVSMGGAFPLVEKQPPRPDDRDHPLKKIYSVPLPHDFEERCAARFGVQMMEVYGQTECGLTNYRTWDAAKPGSCGPANCGYEVKIFDDNDDECPANVEGEIVVRPSRSHIILKEHYRMPEKLGHRLRNCWWHTGDLGVMDEDGYLYFRRRKEESIRFRGHFISTTELEAVVNRHPDVLECAAYRVPDRLDQEHDVAIAVKLRPGCSPSPEELLAHCERDLPFYMVPCYVRWVDAFELTPTMRIVKKGLEEDGVTTDMWNRRTAGYRLSHE